MGAVEDDDLTVAGDMGVDPPQVVVGELGLSWHSETPDRDPLWIRAPEDVANGPVLASGVHRLKHDQQPLPDFCPQLVLELGERGLRAREGCFPSAFPPSKPSLESGS